MDESHPVIKELGSPGALLEGVFALLDRLEIDASTFEADHVCFRCADASEYHRVVALCENVGVRLVEGMIGGRPISTFLLKEPLRFRERSIRCLEVPAPKPGRRSTPGSH